MRTLPAGMQADLDSGATTHARCFRVARKDGTVLGFTDHDRTLSFGGVDYEPQSGFSAGAIETTLGLAVDTTDALGLLKSDRIAEADIAAGLYDNAAVEIWRVDWSDVAKRLLLRSGNLGEVKRGAIGFRAELRGLAHRLNEPEGRLFQKTCDADLGDARCGIDLESATYKGSGTVTSVGTDGSFVASGLSAFVSNWFSRGKVTWTSGANDGLSNEVRSHVKSGSAATLGLWLPPFAAIETGDTFEARAGCDKSFPTCIEKFDNAVNFRGFPTMAGTEFIALYPQPGSSSE